MSDKTTPNAAANQGNTKAAPVSAIDPKTGKPFLGQGNEQKSGDGANTETKASANGNQSKGQNQNAKA